MKQYEKQAVWEALRYGLLSGPLLFLGFFLDAGINSYSADLTGQFFQAVLENQRSAAWELMGIMALTLFVSVILLPAVVLGTNVIYFHFGLKYWYDVISRFFHKTYESVKSYETGAVVQRLLWDSTQLQSLLVILPSKLAACLCAFLFLTWLMFRISAVLCIVCVVLGTVAAVCPLFMRKKLARLDEAQKSFRDQTGSAELEMIQNRSFAKSYGLESFFADRQQEMFETYDRDFLKKGVWTEAWAAVLPEGLSILGKTAFLVIGIFMAISGQMAAGNLVAFFTYLTLLTSLVTQIHQQLRQLAQVPEAVGRVAVLVEEPEAFAEDKNAEKPLVDWKQLRTEGLTYRYAKQEKQLIYGDIRIPRNSLVRLCGENGAGKTTLMWILTGLLQPENGKVFLEPDIAEQDVPVLKIPEQENLNHTDLRKWWEKLSVVEQIPVIFPGSVRENILLGNLGADEKQVESVLQKLGMSRMAERQINTPQQLSGGELKKISLGRALLRDSELLFFDEPYEHLDTESKKIVDKMLADQTKTRVVICHGNELSGADRVLTVGGALIGCQE